MRYKYPKHIRIGSTDFKIKYDKHSFDSHFQYPDKNTRAYIIFGMAAHKKNPGAFLDHVIHELQEILHVEDSTRYWCRGNDAYMFVGDHSKFSARCSHLAGLLNKFIK